MRIMIGDKVEMIYDKNPLIWKGRQGVVTDYNEEECEVSWGEHLILWISFDEIQRIAPTPDNAKDYLCECIAEYIQNGFPLVYLTGEEGYGKPDREHVARLKEALQIAGFQKTAEMLPDTKET